jgi:glycosyltransferase involved in cell wall biosynthesis
MNPKKPSVILSCEHTSGKVATPGIVVRLFILHLREWLEFDSGVVKRFVGLLGLVLGFFYYKMGMAEKAVVIWSKVHSAACSHLVNEIVTRLMRCATAKRDGNSEPNILQRTFREHVESLRPTLRTQKFFDDPKRLLGPMAMVMKSRVGDEKGVISVLYSYTLPLFAKLFDVRRVGERYFLVLEPSWSGYCNLDILSYSQFDWPVFVQTYEPRDKEFIQNLRSNLIPVPLSNNWWVDHRTFRPLPGVTKDMDLIMVAGWASFKRHYSFFRGLKQLRAKGVRLRAILIGYPMEKTRDSIYKEAQICGISDQLEIYESIGAAEVNYHFNRAKVNVLWSRREGWNRALVEGMCAGVPCILRKGHNFGYPYPYINGSTGVYSDEVGLPEALLWMLQNHRSFSPRAWVVENMSCQIATRILSESIQKVAFERGEKWTRGLVAKVSGLHGMQYWQSDDKRMFDDDYEFLSSCIR